MSTYFLNRCTTWKNVIRWNVDVLIEAYRVFGLIEHRVISTSLVLAFLVRRPAVRDPYVAAAY